MKQIVRPGGHAASFGTGNGSALDPRWLTFWRRVRAAAQELNRIEVEQADGENR